MMRVIPAQGQAVAGTARMKLLKRRKPKPWVMQKRKAAHCDESSKKFKLSTQGLLESNFISSCSLPV